MREIKFRAWIDFNDEFVYLNELGDFDGKYESFSWEYVQALETMEQYTGLKDKNGVEIYEGDVIKYESSIESGIGVIKHFFETCNLQCEWITQNTETPSFQTSIEYLMCKSEIEVIGNIRQNPELLK